MLRQVSPTRLLVVAGALFVPVGWLVIPSLAAAGSKSRGQGGIPAVLKAIAALADTSMSQAAELSDRVDALESEINFRLDSLLDICEDPVAVLPDPPPDLLPVPIEGVFDPERAFCRLDASGELVVRVKNQGGSPAGPSTLRVLFDTADSQFTNAPTPPLDPGDEANVPIGKSPFLLDCSPGEERCKFKIFVDDFPGVVAESNEDNNNAMGQCIRIL